MRPTEEAEKRRSDERESEDAMSKNGIKKFVSGNTYKTTVILRRNVRASKVTVFINGRGKITNRVGFKYDTIWIEAHKGKMCLGDFILIVESCLDSIEGRIENITFEVGGVKYDVMANAPVDENAPVVENANK